jgi:iron-sulfur cluster assembly accessory protein
MITVSETAAQEVKRLQLSRQKPNSSLRIRIDHGGCSGLFYQLELNENSPENQISRDRQYQSNGVTILIDEESSIYIEDLQIDYSEDLMGGGFRFDNAKAIRNCNCGQSFSVKHT